MQQQLTRKIGQFTAGCRFEDLPGDAVANATLGVTDSVAVMLAGMNEPAVQKVRRFLGIRSGYPFGTSDTPERDRALLAGTAGHVLDFDDVALDGHTSAVLVPAVLALALGGTERATGRDAIVAYAVGFEVWADLIRRDSDLHHNKGWHPTTVFGAIAAAAACAKLLRLSAEEASHAVAIAASMAAGLSANFGSMTKSFQVGRAAEAGVVAARLAADGFTGAPDVIEHPRGYLHAISPAHRIDTKTAPGLGKVWRLETIGLNVKQYPICYCAHRPVDAMLDILRENPLTPSDIARIDVHLGRTATNILRETIANNALQAKFSLEFAMASAVVAGHVGLKQLQDTFVRSSAVQELMTKVYRHTLDDDATTALPLATADQVFVTTTSGKSYKSAKVAFARGSPALPLDRGALWLKFEECTAPLLGQDARALFDRLTALRNEKSFPEIAELIFGVGEQVS